MTILLSEVGLSRSRVERINRINKIRICSAE